MSPEPKLEISERLDVVKHQLNTEIQAWKLGLHRARRGVFRYQVGGGGRGGGPKKFIVIKRYKIEK